VNIASRCAPFIERAGGQLAESLPEPALYAEFVAASTRIAQLYESRDTAAAIREIMQLADRANQYVDQQKPWILAKDPARLDAARSVATQAINLFRVLLTYLAPVLPKISATAGDWLGAEAFAHWDGIATPLLGTAIGKYPQLATRVDPAIVKQLVTSPATPAPTPAPAAVAVAAKPAKTATPPRTATPTEPGMIGIEDFAKLDLRAARVIEATRVEGSDKLLCLKLDLGDHQRQVFSGISANYAPDQLVGRYVVMIANLAPRKMRFGISEGMVLCASGKAEGGEGVFLLSADAGVQPGMKIS
jgi:methionyl-tRNA synthetase